MAGKPGRKPNERVIRHFLSDMLDQYDAKTERKRIGNICTKLMEAAEDGDLAAIREVFDRVEGKPTTIVEGGDNPVRTVNEIIIRAATGDN